MYCTQCGAVNHGEQNFCAECGSSLLTPGLPVHGETVIIGRSVHSGAIFVTWLLIIISFIPMALINIPFYMAVLISSIVLLSSKNRSAVANGKIMLVFWLLSIAFGFSVGNAKHIFSLL